MPPPAGTKTQAEAALERAITLHKAGLLAMAEVAYRQVLALAPEHIDALHLLGVAVHQQGDPQQAAGWISRALAIDPDFPQAHNNLGLVHLALGHTTSAVAHGRMAVSLAPDYAEAHTNLGNALKAQERLDEAAACHRYALLLRPDYAEAMTNLGAVHDQQGRLDTAATLHRRAIALRPTLTDAYNNLGLALQGIGQGDRATQMFTRTLTLAPDNPLAHWNRGLLRLAAGDLSTGWNDYAYRFQGPQMLKRRRLPIPEWQGDSLAGRRLLLWREQGVGDELMFAACYPDLLRHVAAEGGQVILECEPRLVSLFARSFPTAIVRAERSDTPQNIVDADCHLPAGALPRWFRPGLEAFPVRPGWLVADPARYALWQTRLAALEVTDNAGSPDSPPSPRCRRLRIGLAWRSSNLAGPRRASYSGLRQWEALLTHPAVRVIPLQYGDCSGEIADAEHRYGISLPRWPDLDLKDDFEGTAALIAALDLVITGPTAVGELAGALGAPVWRLAWSGDWSALGTGVRPWFPTMRLFYGRADDSLEHGIATMLTQLERLITDPPAAAPSAKAALEAAVSHHRHGHTTEAETLYRHVLTRNPEQPVALHLWGLLAQQSGDAETAAERIAAAIAFDPAYTAARINLGSVLQELGRYRAAIDQYYAALILRPDAADACTNLGNALSACGDDTAAIAAQERAVAYDPAFITAYINLGTALIAADRLDAAATAFEQAITLDPECSDALAGLGGVRRRQGRLDEATAALLQALTLSPEDARAYTDLGLIRQQQDDLAMALACFDQALVFDPHLATAHFNRGLLCLRLGRLADGWKGYGWRFAANRKMAMRSITLPEWQGESLEKRCILVWREQGVGDELLFATTYPDLIAHAEAQTGAVIIECDPRLTSLFARSFPRATIRPTSSVSNTKQSIPDTGEKPVETTPTPAPQADIHIPAGSLPRWFRPALEHFPPRADVLVADPERVAVWQEKLAILGPGPKIGIAWRSALLSGGRAGAYRDLLAWEPLLTRPGVHFVNLQYGDCATEIMVAERRFGIRIVRWPELDLKDDFENTAALMRALDLVITGPTAAGELAGALGVPVWRLSWADDWTTFGTTRRPWFPSMRLFLTRPGDSLDDAIDRLARTLRP